MNTSKISRKLFLPSTQFMYKYIPFPATGSRFGIGRWNIWGTKLEALPCLEKMEAWRWEPVCTIQSFSFNDNV